MNDSHHREPQDKISPDYKDAPEGDRPPEPDNSKTWLGLILASPVVAALIAGLLAWSPWQHAASSPSPASSSTRVIIPSLPIPSTASYDQSVFVNPTSGAGGTLVRLSGEGFPANARVVFLFSTYQMGDTTTNSDGKFSNVSVNIPTTYSMFAPQQFYIIAESGAFAAQTPFMLTG
jgi:hypothetical protein